MYMDATGDLGDDPLAMTRKELEEMIVWETNNLYEYLKGLYAQDAVAMGGLSRLGSDPAFL